MDENIIEIREILFEQSSLRSKELLCGDKKMLSDKDHTNEKQSNLFERVRLNHY